MRTQKLVGESMRGKDHRILALLYTLAFYAMTDLEFSEVDLSRDDKEIIKKVKNIPAHVFILWKLVWIKKSLKLLDLSCCINEIK